MAKNQIKVTGKRRPSQKRPSFSPRLTPVFKRVKNAAKKVIPKRNKILPASSKKKVLKVKARQKNLFTLPIGRNTSFTFAIIRTEKSASKKNPQKTPRKAPSGAKEKARSKKRQLIFPSILILVGLAGAVFFGMQTIASPIEEPPKASSESQKTIKPPEKKHVLPRSAPVTLRIPNIELNTTLTTIGLAQDGTMEVPADYTKAGWYRESPTPGEKGPAIIVGHLDNIRGQAVFWRLKELVAGQIVEVDREDGKTAKFIIEKVQQVPQDDNFPTQEIYGNTDRAALRLITCGGTFNHLTQRYSDNTVVFATLLPDENKTNQ